jgi:hypothetical protein
MVNHAQESGFGNTKRETKMFVIHGHNPYECMQVLARMADEFRAKIDAFSTIDAGEAETITVMLLEQRALFLLVLQAIDRIYTTALHTSFVGQDGFFDAHARDIDAQQQKISRIQMKQVPEVLDWRLIDHAKATAALVAEIVRSEIFYKACALLIPCVARDAERGVSR